MKEYGSTLRRILLVLALSCFALALCWIVGPLFVDDDPDSAHLAPLLLLPTSQLASAVGFDWDQYALSLAVIFGPLLLAQWMFLRPRAGWKIHLSETGRPMKTAVVAAMPTAIDSTATMLKPGYRTSWRTACFACCRSRAAEGEVMGTSTSENDPRQISDP